MSRRRFVVALVPPSPLREDLQALRRAVGDPRIDRLEPHLTLIPPVNVAQGELATVRELLRRAASRHRRFTLELGPAGTFAPTTPTLHLRVGGDLAALERLRDDLRAGPFDRPDPRPFVPHVTLRNPVTGDHLPAGVRLLAGRLGEWSVDAVTLLRHEPDEAGGHRWSPVHEEPLGEPVVVGRGGVELRLRTGSVLDADVVELVGADAGSGLGWPPFEAPVDRHGSTRRRLVTSASLPTEPDRALGAVVGWSGDPAAFLQEVVVAHDARGFGVGTQLVGRWCSEAAAHGSRAVLADASSSGAGLLERLGFARQADLLVRVL